MTMKTRHCWVLSFVCLLLFLTLASCASTAGKTRAVATSSLRFARRLEEEGNDDSQGGDDDAPATDNAGDDHVDEEDGGDEDAEEAEEEENDDEVDEEKEEGDTQVESEEQAFDGGGSEDDQEEQYESGDDGQAQEDEEADESEDATAEEEEDGQEEESKEDITPNDSNADEEGEGQGEAVTREEEEEEEEYQNSEDDEGGGRPDQDQLEGGDEQEESKDDDQAPESGGDSNDQENGGAASHDDNTDNSNESPDGTEMDDQYNESREYEEQEPSESEDTENQSFVGPHLTHGIMHHSWSQDNRSKCEAYRFNRMGDLEYDEERRNNWPDFGNSGQSEVSPKCDNPAVNARGTYTSNLAPCTFRFHQIPDATPSPPFKQTTVCADENVHEDVSTKVESYVSGWLDECVGDFARCYTLKEIEDKYWKHFCKQDWKLPSGATHVSLDCTADKKAKKEYLEKNGGPENSYIKHEREARREFYVFVILIVSAIMMVACVCLCCFYKLGWRPYLAALKSSKSEPELQALIGSDDDNNKAVGSNGNDVVRLRIRRKA